MLDLQLKNCPKIEWFSQTIVGRGAIFETQYTIMGDHNVATNTIRISAEQSAEEVMRTVAHELRHAYQCRQGDGADSYSESWEFDADEYAKDCIRVAPEWSMYKFYRTDATRKGWYIQPVPNKVAKPKVVVKQQKLFEFNANTADVRKLLEMGMRAAQVTEYLVGRGVSAVEVRRLLKEIDGDDKNPAIRRAVRTMTCLI